MSAAVEISCMLRYVDWLPVGMIEVKESRNSAGSICWNIVLFFIQVVFSFSIYVVGI
jgi:hypothetical protein